MAQGKPAEAAAEFQLALQANPRFVDALNNLGMAFDAQGRLDEAIDAFRRATVADPKSAVAFANLGKALATRGAPARLSPPSNRRSRSPRPTPRLTTTSGGLWLESGNLGTATTSLREAIRLKPDYAEAHNNLGIALASQGQMADAIREWRKALEDQAGLRRCEGQSGESTTVAAGP